MIASPKTKGSRNPAPPSPPGKSVDPDKRRGGIAPPLLVFTLLFVVLLYPLLSGKAEPRWDARDMIYPSFAYSVDSFSEGRLPLWDPYSNCGYPFHAEPGTPAWNPVTPLLGFLFSDTGTGFIAYWLLHWWWGGAGMLRWAMKRGAGAAGGLAAAAAYAFSGFFVGHAEHTSFIVIAGWLPWIFQLAGEATETGRTDLALLAGSAFGVACLGGYPGLMTFAGLALGLWLLLAHVADPSPGSQADARRRALSALKTLALVGAVGIAAWSPSLHAFFVEGNGYSERVGSLPPEVANVLGPFPPSAMLSLFFPFVGIIAREAIATDISMSNGYIGLLAIPLALAWFLRREGARRPWGIAVFILFMFLLSIGGQAGLRTLMYYLFPPLRFMRFSAPFRLFWILPLCLAAGQGIGLLARQPDARRLALRLVAGWCGVTAAAALLLGRFLASAGVDASGGAAAMLIPAFLLLAASLLALAIASRPAPARTGAMHLSVALAALVVLDTGFHLRGNSLTIWSPGDSIRQAEARHRRTTALDGDPGPRLPPLPFGFYNAHLLLKVALSKNYVTMLSKGFDEVLAAPGSRFLEVLERGPRFWLSPGVTPAPSREAALAALARSGVADNVPVFVDRVPAGLDRGTVAPGAFGSVRILSYAPERVALAVDVPGDDNAFLASTERTTAGWTAAVDGVPQPPVRANLYFRGLVVPPGSHSIVWEYRPSGLFPLIALSLIALLAGASAPMIRRLVIKSPTAEATPK